MTIIVGLICKNAIVLASDSQTTTGTSKRCDAEKFAIVKFSNAEVLVAQAGNASSLSRVIEVLRDLAKGQKLTDYRGVADIAQKAMRQLKDELRVQNCDCSMEKLRAFIQRDDTTSAVVLALMYREVGRCCRAALIFGLRGNAALPFSV
jgi:ATP-dependent protease HslVU (ClpYQ) peptidase subunit